MRKDLTEIVVVMDRSGSMASTKNDAERGLNHFVAEQKKLPGEARFTLHQFDTQHETVHDAILLKDVPACTLEPRGSTALLDAVGRAILGTGKRLEGISEAERPGLVVFVVVTDGEENSSREFTNAKIREMIEHQTKVYKWQFTYLGAHANAFAEARAMGFSHDTIAVATQDSGHAMNAIYTASTSNVARMRRATMAGSAVLNSYTVTERATMIDEDDEDEKGQAQPTK